MKRQSKHTKKKYCYSQEKVHVKWGEQENDIRNNWPSRSHYLMTTFGLLIGTGNLAAFPKECLQYGGFVYIIMYMVALAILGMPLTLLELAVGQYTSQVWYQYLWLRTRFCVQMRANFWPNFLFSVLNHSNVLKDVYIRLQKVENSILNLKNDI